MDKKYNKNFVRVNLKLSGEKQLDRVTTFVKGDITSSKLKQSGLLPVRLSGGLACGMGFEGKLGDLRAIVCEITVCFDRKDSGAKQKVGILNGVWMELKLDKNTGNDFLLIERTVFDSGTSKDYYGEMGYQEISIRNHDFSKKFCLFGTGESSEQDKDGFLKAYGKLIDKPSEEGCGLMLRYSGMKVYAFLVGRKLAFDTPVRGEITEDVVAWNRLLEFSMLLEMVSGK